MRAQYLYDLREQTAFCSGTELHEFFFAELRHPSPRGHRKMPSTRRARSFVATCVAAIRANSGHTLEKWPELEALERELAEFAPTEEETMFDSMDVSRVIASLDLEHAIVAIDTDRQRVVIRPKFGPDPRPRSYVTASTHDELVAEIRAFDARISAYGEKYR